MPELPEVESLRSLLDHSVAGRTIVGGRIGKKPLRRQVTRDFIADIKGRRIERVARRAKYLLIELSGGLVIVAHLGMSGSITHRAGITDSFGLAPQHDHAEFALDDGTRLVFNDPRRFGTLRLVDRASLSTLMELGGLGPEPLGGGFNADYLADKARGRKIAIKNLLMDQRVVAGIGNIYASEILFRAAVRPTRRSARLNRAEIERIARVVPEVLGEAIEDRGTTFRNYLDSRGEPGRFAAKLLVYGRQGEPCVKCGSPIRRVVVGQRASFYCPKCQR
jgi:formamidopyrimidine-DNA glycosylase